MNSNIECPVDFVSVNENQVRITAYQVMYLAVAWVIFSSWIIMAFLASDFFLRAFNFGKYSLLNIISGFVVKKLSISNKPVDRAPKRFAALTGLAFSAAILVFSLVELETLAIILASILIVFAFLEAVLGFCAGCYVYALYKRSTINKVRLQFDKYKLF